MPAMSEPAPPKTPTQPSNDMYGYAHDDIATPSRPSARALPSVSDLASARPYDFSHNTICARKKVFAAITIPLLLHACR
jgi:hypothetical protein